MAVAFQQKVRISIDVAGERVTFICRPPTGKEVSEFLNRRFVTRRNKIESRLYDARRDFVDSILLDIENAEWENANGELLPLNAATELTEEDKRHCAAILGAPVESWKDLIPLNWKASVAMHFEDVQGEGEGN